MKTIIEIRAGEGGDDAAKFAGELASAFESALRRSNLKSRRVNSGSTIVLETTEAH